MWIMAGTGNSETRLVDAIVPVAGLFVLIIYGLVLRPLAWHQTPLPLELIFITAATWAVLYLRWLGHRWAEIQASIVAKLAKALPAFFILFSIGLIIASWIVCGTIPMLVWWGLKIVDPAWLYIVAFVATIIFSSLTGTSWGSVGTIGVVILGVATAQGADLGITAGAIIGGAYFGDKLSPLSDTTNLAALAAEVDLYDHIRSMLVTTLPSACLAGAAYLLLGMAFPVASTELTQSSLDLYLNGLADSFRFSVWLLLPPAIVLIGSWRRLPTVPVLIVSVIVAAILAIILQPFTVADVFTAIHKGFDSASMIRWTDVPEPVSTLLDRGGLYALNEAITTAFMVFIFIGTLDHIRAMPTLVNTLLPLVRGPRSTVVATLTATGVTNAMISNQYATSFIVGDAFKSKFDEVGLSRTVLSRSLEDTGTMIESVIPWTATSLFMVQTLGVPFADYWHWQLLSLINIGMAYFLALTGWGLIWAKEKPLQ